MTKRWSSTRSLDGKTKRQASKDARAKYKPEMVDLLRRLDEAEPESTFTSGEKMMNWLNDDA